jgi:5-hydroxyisourate hydrolase
MISTHILDTSKGLPAAGVRVVLEKQSGTEWIPVSDGMSNQDGRFVFANSDGTGCFRILFEIEPYLAGSGTTPFFLNLPIAFRIEDASRKYHIPLLLSPFGLSSYRGS